MEIHSIVYPIHISGPHSRPTKNFSFSALEVFGSLKQYRTEIDARREPAIEIHVNHAVEICCLSLRTNRHHHRQTCYTKISSFSNAKSWTRSDIDSMALALNVDQRIIRKSHKREILSTIFFLSISKFSMWWAVTCIPGLDVRWFSSTVSDAIQNTNIDDIHIVQRWNARVTSGVRRAHCALQCNANAVWVYAWEQTNNKMVKRLWSGVWMKCERHYANSPENLFKCSRAIPLDFASNLLQISRHCVFDGPYQFIRCVDKW